MKQTHVYQHYLNDEFKKRKERNSSYSLRAYARDLNVPSSKLSQYLKGACGISKNKAETLVAKLKLGSKEAELFICSAEAAHSRDPLLKEMAQKKLKLLKAGTFSQLNIEKFNLIRDWYHLAILELTETEQFQSDPKWVATALGIPKKKANEAIERLNRLGLLDVSGSKWSQTQKDFETPPEFSSRAIRDYHMQVMNLTEGRIENVSLEKRELGSVMFAFDRELVPEMKELVRNFQREVAAMAEKSQKKDSLYTLNLQLMPIYEGDSI